MQQLIREVFLRHFTNPSLDALSDAGILDGFRGRIAVTTDSYVVDPLFFPGGDIGKMAVCGTLNDLAVSFATPVAITASFILEEGLPVSTLEKIVRSMAAEAEDAGVPVVAGDTKVVHKGLCDKVFINTSGIGFLPNPAKGSAGRTRIRPGDCIIMSGYQGDHAIAILLAREEFSFSAKVRSDCRNLFPVIRAITTGSKKIRFMRDVTRGGLSTILNELAGAKAFGLEIAEQAIPVRKEVRAVCELLGYDPLNLANEGKFIAVVGKEDAADVVAAIRVFPGGKGASVIGTVVDDHPGKVILKTVSGGTRLVEMVSGEQLPRIC